MYVSLHSKPDYYWFNKKNWFNDTAVFNWFNDIEVLNWFNDTEVFNWFNDTEVFNWFNDTNLERLLSSYHTQLVLFRACNGKLKTHLSGIVQHKIQPRQGSAHVYFISRHIAICSFHLSIISTRTANTHAIFTHAMYFTNLWDIVKLFYILTSEKVKQIWTDNDRELITAWGS